MSNPSHPQDDASVAAARRHSLENLIDRCEGAYAPNTIRGYGADLRAFQTWCISNDTEWLAASSQAVADFVDHQIGLFAPSTVKRRICAINFAHRLADLPSPTEASVVHLALRRAARRKRRRPAQAQGLTSEILNQILAELPTKTLAGLRDAALISVGYDTLCRSGELAALTVADLRPSADEHWSVLIPRSKGDQAGDGRIAWLSPPTVEHLKRWIEASDVESGPLFRSLHLGRVAETALDTSSIRRLIKRAARGAGIEQASGPALSGHSMRVGAAQDMLVAGFDALAIMQAGGWKTASVLLRYVENATTQSLHQRRWAILQSWASPGREFGPGAACA